jgi:hypothetical protein
MICAIASGEATFDHRLVHRRFANWNTHLISLAAQTGIYLAYVLYDYGFCGNNLAFTPIRATHYMQRSIAFWANLFFNWEIYVPQFQSVDFLATYYSLNELSCDSVDQSLQVLVPA